jgi:hypothetical protein
VTALVLSAEQQALVDRYAADLHAARLGGVRELLWGARAFCARIGAPEAWNRLPLAKQLACNVKLHRFVAWLAATRRLRLSADYLVARRPRLGEIVARHDPAFHAQFQATAAALGFGRASVACQWAALAQLCALHGLAPGELTHAQLDAGRAALVAAARRRGRGGKDLRTAIFGLESTLFHAGVTDQLPRRQTPDKASVRAGQWVTVAPAMAATMHDYLAQLRLSLRPGTVRNAEATLREFARFLAEHDPAVTCVAEIDRRHVEAYKAWLAERPAARGGPLHRHTIRDRLMVLRNFFERLLEWGTPDAPARVPLFAGDLPIADEALPRFLDDGAAAKLLVAARADPDPFVRLCVEFLARTGLRKGEFLGLTVDAVVQIGASYWLRVPVGKLHTDATSPCTHSSRPCWTTGWPGAPTGCAPTSCSSSAAGRSASPGSTTPWPRSPARPASAACPPTSCATRWPPRRSTAACRWRRSPPCWATARCG